MELHWEQDLADLLSELSSVQEELFATLAEKREHLRATDGPALLAMQPREQAIMQRLQDCHDRRTALLQSAASEGLPSNSLTSLAGVLDSPARSSVQKQISQASQRARLLQHQSLAQWVMVQRTMLHLSQMLEIIATGGQLRPTYGKEDSSGVTGGLVDHAA